MSTSLRLNGQRRSRAVRRPRKVYTSEQDRHAFSLLFSAQKKATYNENYAANELLQSFPYYSNYIDLVRMELSAISSALPEFPPHNVAIVILGSGPLPLTSLCILRQLTDACVNTTCHNVDMDEPAIASSTEICRALGVEEPSMRFQCADATSKELNLGECDVVYLAALVGESSRQKQEILANVVRKTRPGTLVVLRSAHSLRRLLYPVCEAQVSI